MTFFLCFLVLASCVSVPKLLEKGKLEKAYAVARKHCTRARAQKPFGKARLKALYQFEDAYAAIQARDYARVRALRKRPEERRWVDLYELYGALYSRSEDLIDFVPGTEQLRRYPELRPATLEVRREEARRKAGHYYLNLAKPELSAAFAGEKPAARRAYDAYVSALDYLPERATQLTDTIDQLREIGTLRILLYADPRTAYYPEMESTLRDQREYERDWTEIVSLEGGRRIDLHAEVDYLNYRSSGLRESNSCENYSKEILDRIEKVKKEKKLNDSTTVIVIKEVKHYKTIHASVTTYHRSLSVTATGLLSVYQPTAVFPEWREEMTARQSWSNEYSVCSGDKRALPAFACGGLRRSPPSEASLLARAVCQLPYAARQRLIRRYGQRESPAQAKRGRVYGW